MRAAIYCRKSTDQSEVHESEKSVAHQQERCMALVLAKGWTLAEGHVYTDDGISGAVFGAGRPALLRLMEAVKGATRPFDVLVAYDESRLGRDVIETGYLVKQIVDRDVRLFFSDGTERRLDTATAALMMSVTAFGGAFEREQASVRVRDKMRSKAGAGHSTGTVPFGYVSVAVNSHRELAIDPERAEIIRHIFTLSAAGHGITRIAHALNREHPGVRKWSAPGVRDILTNRVYEGVVVYGKRRALVKGGKKLKVTVPERDWITVAKPELRIVPEALWKAVADRKATMFSSFLRQKNGRLQGRPESTVSEHLLTGLVACGTCGGRLVVWSRSGVHYRYLVCWRHKSGGDGACTNGRSVPLGALTDMVVSHFRDILTPARLAQVARDMAADADASPVRVAERRQALDAELHRVEARIVKLTDAIGEAEDSKALLVALRAQEATERELRARLGQITRAQENVALTGSADHPERVAGLLADWQAALQGAPAVARQVLRKLLVGPIVVTVDPHGDGFLYRAQGTYTRVIAGAFGGAEPETVTVSRMGVVADDDLSQELKALAEAASKSDGTGGRNVQPLPLTHQRGDRFALAGRLERAA